MFPLEKELREVVQEWNELQIYKNMELEFNEVLGWLEKMDYEDIARYIEMLKSVNEKIKAS